MNCFCLRVSKQSPAPDRWVKLGLPTLGAAAATALSSLSSCHCVSSCGLRTPGAAHPGPLDCSSWRAGTRSASPVPRRAWHSTWHRDGNHRFLCPSAHVIPPCLQLLGQELVPRHKLSNQGPGNFESGGNRLN